MSEAQGITSTGLPIDIFPEKMQSIILDMMRYENYKPEYLVPSMLSATSSALGGTYNIRVKNQWITNAAMYMILVGKPGLGKTPPLDAAYRPIRRADTLKLEKYKLELDAYQNAFKESKGQTSIEKPVLSRTIVSDFTPEALIQAHYNSPRGVTILVDEIIGMFNSANRYNNGQLIEQLLSAWSGTALDVIRASSDTPLHIEHPCINMIGTTQTKRMNELLKKGYEENGFLDRIVFSYPKDQQISLWAESGDDENYSRSAKAQTQWQTILDNVLGLTYASGENTKNPVSHIINMEPTARKLFFEWHNDTIRRANGITDEALAESRPMKAPSHVARFALTLQVLRYVCGESHLQFVSQEAIDGAIRLHGFFEDSYRRIRDFVDNEACDDPAKDLLSILGDTFTTAEAKQAGKQLEISDRTTMNYLEALRKNRLIHKIRQGQYQKIGMAEGNSQNRDTGKCNV